MLPDELTVLLERARPGGPEELIDDVAGLLLGHFVMNDDLIRQVFEELRESGSWTQKTAFARALGWCSSTPEIESVLIALLYDSDPTVREEAYVAIETNMEP